MYIERNQAFVNAFGLYLDIKLDPSYDWEPLTTFYHEQLPQWDLKNLLNKIEAWRWAIRHDECHEQTHDKLNHFYSLVLPALLKKPHEYYSFIDLIVPTVRAWTMQGGQEIPSVHMQTLGPIFKKDIQESKGFIRREQKLVEALYYSPQLWHYTQDTVLPMLMQEVANHRIKVSNQNLMHKFRPDLIELQDKSLQISYASMCGMLDEHRLDPVQAQHILVGPHHRAISWFLAIDLAMAEDNKAYLDKPEAFQQQWDVIQNKLSTLVLDPCDKESWALWSMLEEKSKHSDVIHRAHQTIREAHPHMYEAYTTYWPLIETMFEDEEDQQEEAAKYCQQQGQALEALPVNDLVL